MLIMTLAILAIQTAAFVSRPVAIKTMAGSGAVLAYATTSITPVDLLNQTNQERAAGGLPPLQLNAKLNQSAQLKANNMFAEDYWAHVSPSGIQPWYWFGQAGYGYQYAGENLAKDFDTTAGAIAGWMNSPGHRANIMNTNYVDVGFAVMNGTLVGGQTTLIVAHYGALPNAQPAPAPAPAPVQAATPAVRSAATPVPATPTPTPAATPTPTPSPSLTPSPSPLQIARGEITPGAPAPKRYSLFQPLSLTQTLNWATLATMTLLGLLLLVYALTHATVWRRGLSRWRSPRYRLFAAAQLSGLLVAIIALASSGFGQVG